MYIVIIIILPKNFKPFLAAFRMWCKEILEVLQAKEVELTAENQIGEYILVGVATIGLQAYVDEIKVSNLSGCIIMH